MTIIKQFPSTQWNPLNPFDPWANPLVPTAAPQPTVQKTIITQSFVQPVSKSEFKPKRAGMKGAICYLIVDESGSMQPQRNDTIGGINAFIEAQKKDKDGMILSIVTFDGNSVRTPVDKVEISKVEKFDNYRPNAMTNLLDAIGQTMHKINDDIKRFVKSERPAVFVQIITDGGENSSRSYKRDEIKHMIEKSQGKDWVFTYIGANVDAFGEASSLGLSGAAAANYSVHNTMDAFQTISASMSNLKGLRSAGVGVAEMNATNAYYSEEDRKKLMETEAK